MIPALIAFTKNHLNITISANPLSPNDQIIADLFDHPHLELSEEDCKRVYNLLALSERTENTEQKVNGVFQRNLKTLFECGLDLVGRMNDFPSHLSTCSASSASSPVKLLPLDYGLEEIIWEDKEDEFRSGSFSFTENSSTTCSTKKGVNFSFYQRKSYREETLLTPLSITEEDKQINEIYEWIADFVIKAINEKSFLLIQDVIVNIECGTLYPGIDRMFALEEMQKALSNSYEFFLRKMINAEEIVQLFEEMDEIAKLISAKLIYRGLKATPVEGCKNIVLLFLDKLLTEELDNEELLNFTLKVARRGLLSTSEISASAALVLGSLVSNDRYKEAETLIEKGLIRYAQRISKMEELFINALELPNLFRAREIMRLNKNFCPLSDLELIEGLHTSIRSGNLEVVQYIISLATFLDLEDIKAAKALARDHDKPEILSYLETLEPAGCCIIQ